MRFGNWDGIVDCSLDGFWSIRYRHLRGMGGIVRGPAGRILAGLVWWKKSGRTIQSDTIQKKDGGKAMVTGGELTSKDWRRDSLLGEDCGTDHKP
jgi:hypothetical protein